MPRDERKHAKIISFSDNWGRQLDRPLNPAAFEEARRHFEDLAVHFRRIADGFGAISYEVTMLKNRPSFTPPPGGKAIEFETSFRIRLTQQKARVLPPTAWEHLLRDEGLG